MLLALSLLVSLSVEKPIGILAIACMWIRAHEDISFGERRRLWRPPRPSRVRAHTPSSHPMATLTFRTHDTCARPFHLLSACPTPALRSPVPAPPAPAAGQRYSSATDSRSSLADVHRVALSLSAPHDTCPKPPTEPRSRPDGTARAAARGAHVAPGLALSRSRSRGAAAATVATAVSGAIANAPPPRPSTPSSHAPPSD